MLSTRSLRSVVLYSLIAAATTVTAADTAVAQEKCKANSFVSTLYLTGPGNPCNLGVLVFVAGFPGTCGFENSCAFAIATWYRSTCPNNELQLINCLNEFNDQTLTGLPATGGTWFRVGWDQIPSAIPDINGVLNPFGEFQCGTDFIPCLLLLKNGSSQVLTSVSMSCDSCE